MFQGVICETVDNQLENYTIQSDTVQMFLVDENYEKSINDYTAFKELFELNRGYCNERGYRFWGKKTFGERLKNVGFETENIRVLQII